MDTKDTKKPTLAEAVSAWAAAGYAQKVASEIHSRGVSMIVDQSGLAPAWWRHGRRLEAIAVSLMEGAIHGNRRNAIPGLDGGVEGKVFDAFSGSGGLGPAEILARGELLAAGVQNAEAIGELVLEWRETDRRRAQELADVAFGMGGTVETPPLYSSGSFVLVSGTGYPREQADRMGPGADLTMTPEEWGAYVEQEEHAREVAGWAQEAPEVEPSAETDWFDDTDSLPGGFDPAAELEERGAVAPDTTNEEDHTA